MGPEKRNFKDRSSIQKTAMVAVAVALLVTLGWIFGRDHLNRAALRQSLDRRQDRQATHAPSLWLGWVPRDVSPPRPPVGPTPR